MIIMSYLSSINLTVVHFLEEKKKSLLREVIVTSLVWKKWYEQLDSAALSMHLDLQQESSKCI